MALLLGLAAAPATPAGEREYLSAAEIGGIGAVSTATLLLGTTANNFDSSRSSLIRGPLPGEGTLQRLLGGRYSADRRYFLDSDFGSAFTPALGGVIIAGTDLGWPADDREKDFAQDLFLYTSGLFATKGITSLVKGITARPRPLLQLAPGEAGRRPEADYAYDHQSFFSGHTSSAFFAMVYVNKHLRSVMRRELSAEDYRDWRWVSPVVTLGWASVVGWSRIDAYKHYLSDVVAGALAGWALAELFYEIGHDYAEPVTAVSRSPLFIRLEIPF